MSLRVSVLQESGMNELIGNHPEFSFLGNRRILQKNKYKWLYDDVPSRLISVIVIGKSGYGKSTTLNRIVGSELFRTSCTEACTKDLYAAMYKLGGTDDYFALCDLPGVGESAETDKRYYQWYRDMLEKASCAVYMLRADQRDFSLDLNVYNSIFEKDFRRKNVVTAINYADKIEPISRTAEISYAQKCNLAKKENTVKKLFGTDNVVTFSADTGYNFDKLMSAIADAVKADCGS